MAEVEERYRSPASLRATRWLVVLCVAIYALELALGPLLIEVAQFSTTLAPVEPWRFATGNLLHDAWLPVHLLANAIAILVFGPLVERPLGARATFFVMAISGLAAMGGSALAGYERVVGASGIASGLVGAVLWLEFRQPDRLPASWRLPRRIFVTLLVIDASITSLVPWIATGGHLGGFAGGALAAGLVAGPVLRGLPQPAWLTLGNVLLALVYLASVGAVGFELAASDGIMARRGTRLLELGSAPPELLNDTAWWIATEPEPSDAALTTALELAERAVNATERGDPNILDTLAEVLFLLGRKAESIAAIDEAIDLEPRERYFREQRRRFTGDRPFDDRPVPPGFTPPLEVEPDPGIRV
jgi:membrane associated rhomboid family serine protease